VNENGKTISGPLYDKIGEGWHPLLDTFDDLIQWDTRFNNMPPVEITGLEEKQRTLRIYYNGGNSNTDAYVNFVRNLSARVCEECGGTKCDCTFRGCDLCV
jgi:hypothetical protein